MDIQAILTRIEAKATERKVTIRALSILAGLSPDGIRNWQRRLAAGEENAGLNALSLDKVARALGVTTQWLINGEGEPNIRAAGFSEGAMQRFDFIPAAPVDQGDPKALLRAMFGAGLLTPETYAVKTALPGFAILAGDVLVGDLARLPRPGELAIVTRHNTDDDTSKTELRRYLPPYLLSGDPSEDDGAIRSDDNTVAIRHVIVGSFRPPNKNM